ncbi:MAG: phosphatidylglycerol:prolipoprotein diacylglycerol transferase [Cyclobacteriaceae bacterium]|jgi:phosphatidylglycerol:prolipoprotein diacylglycerol transferase
MHPELFTIGSLTIHTYGFMIMLGAIMGYFYMSTVSAKELGIPSDKIQNLAIIIIVSAFVGGKLFFYFEKPGYYFSSWDLMANNFRTGFVFYGSLLFAIPAIVWYFRKEKFPLWPMLDRIAITGAIIHVFGRMGCFFAGCCYGVPTDSFLGITFSNPESQAKPLHTALHPTQLYEASMILGILVILYMMKRHKRLEGRLIFVYVTLYAVGRSIIEIFRGDLARGFIIEGVLSHSQFISILVVATAAIAYFVGYKRKV